MPSEFSPVKLVWWFIALSLFLGVLIQLIHVSLLRDNFLRSIDDLLEDRIDNVVGVYALLQGERLSPEKILKELNQYTKFKDRNAVLEVQGLGREVVSLGNRGDQERREALRRVVMVTSTDGREYRMIGRAYHKYAFFFSLPGDEVDRLWQDRVSLFQLILPSFVTVVVVSLLLFVQIRFLRPIRRLRNFVDSLQTAVPRDVPQTGSRWPGMHGLVDQVSEITKGLERSRMQALNFSSLASHEIRTPLAMIRSQMENALDAKTPAKGLRRIVASAYDDVLRLSGTVMDLLSLGTMQAGTLSLRLEEVSLGEFLKSFYDEALLLTRSKKVSITLKRGPRALLQADRLRLRQVFLNLLENAIKHTPEGGRIRVSYEVVQNNSVLIKFADTGSGILPEALPRVFDPFYREKSNGSDKGTGLGLAVAKWIVRLHRGSIAVESEPKEGTTFFIHLPLLDSEKIPS